MPLRNFTVELKRAADRTVVASISSEEPFLRHDGLEVLSHAESAIDLSRCPLPLLIEHDTGKLNIGIISGLKIVGKKLRGLVKFGVRKEADEIYKDVKNGVLQFLSVAYEVIKTQPTKDGYLVTRWRPYEASIVSVAADVTVGFGRNYKSNKFKNKRKHKMEYSRENLSNIIERMKIASGDSLHEIGADFDRCASVVFAGDAPTFSDIGKGGILAWARQADQEPDRTPMGMHERNDSPLFASENRIFTSFGEQMRAIVTAGSPGGSVDPRLHEVRAASGLNESVPSEGGFLIEGTFSNQILENVWGNNEILKRIRKYSIGGNSNSLKIPGFDESDRGNGERFGGVQSYWLKEAGTFTDSKPKFRMIELTLNKLIGLCYSTSELFQDSTAIESYIKRAFQGELEFRIQDAIINGSGSGQPLGLNNSGAMISVAKEAGQSGETIIWENIQNMWSRLLPGSRKNAAWLISQDCEPQLNSMSIAVGTAGVPVYLPSGGASVSGFNTLMGRPVIPCEQCATCGTTGDIILADFKGGYIGIDKGGMKTDSSIHVLFLTDQNTLRFVYRFDGQPVMSQPVQPFNNGVSQSHFVKLDERA